MLVAAPAFGLIFGCTSLPEPQVQRYSWPKAAYRGELDRPYKTLGLVRTKVAFVSLDPNHEEEFLCQNAFNQAARDLIKRAKDAGGDAVADVKSVTFLINGETEKHSTAECTDDGAEGQLLAQGVAVKWTGPAPSPRPGKARSLPRDSARPMQRASEPAAAREPVADAPAAGD